MPTIDIYRNGRLIATLPADTTLRDVEALRAELIADGAIPPDAYLKPRRVDHARPSHV